MDEQGWGLGGGAVAGMVHVVEAKVRGHEGGSLQPYPSRTSRGLVLSR